MNEKTLSVLDETQVLADFVAIESIGKGQNFSVKRKVLNELYKGNKVRVLDAKGEFTELVKSLGGRTIPLDEALSNGDFDDELIVSFSLGGFETLLSEDYQPQVFTLPKKGGN